MRKGKRQGFLLISLALILLMAIIYNFTTNYSSLATDSGWDSSYDSGGSWDSGSSYSGGGSSSSSGGDVSFSTVFVIIVIILIIAFIIDKNNKNNKKNNVEVIPTMNLSMEDRKLLEDCYNIFCQIQIAWMNFDYNTLRSLVTDELFNSYQNQLNVLNLKGQKNIMANFSYQGGRILSRQTNGTIETVVIRLAVSFNDYVVDQNNNVVRGNANRLLNMQYELTFVYNTAAIELCPNCGARLEPSATICPYCRGHIQAVRSNMRLSKKNLISQK